MSKPLPVGGGANFKVGGKNVAFNFQEEYLFNNLVKHPQSTFR